MNLPPWDNWTALQFDNAVVMLGRAIENSLEEMQNVGDDKHPKWERKYHLADLLDPNYRIVVEQQRKNNIDHLRGVSGIKIKRMNPSA